MTDKKRIAVIRTSDRISFKSCRRKWNWSSHLRENLGPLVHADPLWLGSAMHYALEDFHSENKYGSPAMALLAYAQAFGKKTPSKVPEDWKELAQLGVDMMNYYELWLKGRDPLKTFMYEGKPQVEVNIKANIPWEALERICDPARFARIRATWDEVVYSLQLDRVVIDDEGHLWIVEYKSAKRIETNHFQNDPQVSAYMWGAEQVYDQTKYPLAGVIYQQHKKKIPDAPKWLKNETFSIAQNQSVSHRSYRQALIEKYGTVDEAPIDNVQFLNRLAVLENEHWDEYIRRDKVYRNKQSSRAFVKAVLYEIIDMLDPALPLYSNPTRMCGVMCNYMSPCVSMDDGGDWKHELQLEFEAKPETYDEWRECLPEPTTFIANPLKIGSV